VKTKLVNYKSGEQYDEYVGSGSQWDGPFVIGKDGNKEECEAKYEKWIRTQPYLMVDIPSLEDKVLGCEPSSYVGGVLIKLINELKTITKKEVAWEFNDKMSISDEDKEVMESARSKFSPNMSDGEKVMFRAGFFRGMGWMSHKMSRKKGD